MIWRDPDATCFDEKWKPINAPIAVVEWKADLRASYSRLARLSAYDINWLSAAARNWPMFVGYAVVLHRDALLAGRFHADERDVEWLRRGRIGESKPAARLPISGNSKQMR